MSRAGTRALVVFIAILTGLVLTAGTASATDTELTIPITSVELNVYPWGGSVTPLQANKEGVSTSNPGAVTISNAVTGAVVFSDALSFDFDPDAVPQNVWGFNSLSLAPGSYQYCGSIAAGNGFSGWTSCQNYFTEADQLWGFQTGHNAKSSLVIPLRIDPALSGQTATVAVTRYRWVSGGYTGWKKTKSSSYQTTVQPGQEITAGEALRRNQQAKVVVTFPSLQEVSSANAGGSIDNTNWDTLAGCTEFLRGALTPRLIPPWLSKKKLSKPDFVGQRSYC